MKSLLFRFILLQKIKFLIEPTRCFISQFICFVERNYFTLFFFSYHITSCLSPISQTFLTNKCSFKHAQRTTPRRQKQVNVASTDFIITPLIIFIYLPPFFTFLIHFYKTSIIFLKIYLRDPQKGTKLNASRRAWNTSYKQKFLNYFRNK